MYLITATACGAALAAGNDFLAASMFALQVVVELWEVKNGH